MSHTGALTHEDAAMGKGREETAQQRRRQLQLSESYGRCWLLSECHPPVLWLISRARTLPFACPILTPTSTLPLGRCV